MKTPRLTTILALLIVVSASVVELAVRPQSSTPTIATATVASAAVGQAALIPAPVITAARWTVPQVPLLLVVDGVKYRLDELPLLTIDRIYAIRVIKGRAALARYGPEGAYGVVIITTRQAATPRV